ncbi:MAG: NAD(P)/FAD-dependent oxidoreductase [Crenarchaeota archaeon]|nr:NAD(P)/FAD-dependent oxidoreductase [Thermoproteota archaeon]
MICVVGAGVAGLLTAAHIKDYSVAIYESLPRAGYRDHCAGIVSVDTCRALGATDLIDSAYRSAVISVGPLKFRISCGKHFAVHIDRIGLELELLRRVLDSGHRIFFGKLVVSATSSVDGVTLKIANRDNGSAEEIRCSAVIVAEGFNQSLSRSLGLSAVREDLVGAQLEVELEKRVDCEELKIVFDEKLTPRGFAWVAPIGDGRRALVGAVRKPPMENPREFLESIARFMRLEVRSVARMFGGHVFAGYPKKVVSSDGTALGVGDCVAMVKSLSGGGLYAISRAAPQISMLAQGKRCGNDLEKLLRELRNGYRLFKALHSALRYAPSSRRKLEIDIYLNELNYDNHVETLLSMMRTFGTERMRIRWSSEDADNEVVNSG